MPKLTPLLLGFLGLFTCVFNLSSAQEALQAIPLLSDERGVPRLYSSEIVGEGQARGRVGDLEVTRDYRSKLLVDPNSGRLVDIAWTFYEKPSRVVPTVVTRMSGDARAETFGYVNGFLVGFLANVCFDITEKDLEALGTWYVATLETLAEAGQGEVTRRFGPVHVSLELKQAAKGRSRMEQTVWRGGKPGESWSSFCRLEPLPLD